jgi:capsular polysaccharide transport system permease protein
MQALPTQARSGNLRAAFRVFVALMIREMITRYGRSWGGYAWAVLEPFAMILILSAAFSYFFDRPAIGSSFLLYYATGYLTFHFFNQVATHTGLAVQVNRELMQLPAVRPLDAVLARFVLAVLTLAVVMGLILGIVAATMSERLHFDPAAALLAMGAAATFGLGVGTLNVVLFAALPVWRQVWGLVSAPLMILSAVFYSFDVLPNHIQNVLWWNPVLQAVGQMRAAFYPFYNADYVNLIYVYGLGLGLFILGAALILRHASAIIESR